MATTLTLSRSQLFSQSVLNPNHYSQGLTPISIEQPIIIILRVNPMRFLPLRRITLCMNHYVSLSFWSIKMSINLSNISGWAIFEAGYTTGSTLPEKPVFHLLNFAYSRKTSRKSLLLLSSLKKTKRGSVCRV